MDGITNGPNGNPTQTTPPARRGRDNQEPALDSLETKRILEGEMGATPALNPEASEEQTAEILRQVLGEIRCHDDEWHLYDSGCWLPVSSTRLGDATLKLLHPAKRSERRASAVIRHLGMILNAETVSEYRTFILQEPERTLINCANGVLAVSRDKIELLAHSSNYNFVKRLAVQFDPKAQCPKFMETLKRTMPDLEDAELFQLFCGYIFMDDCRFQCCLMLSGPSATGKSTLLNAIAGVFGMNLISGIGLAQLCDYRAFALPVLKGKALNMATELDTKELMESSIFKALVCGELIPNRQMRKEWEDQKAHCKHFFAANNPPYFAHCTDAELRRLRMIACEHKIRKPSAKFERALENEGPGIFNFMLSGLQQLFDREEMPHGGEQSQRRTERYQAGAMPVETFAKERLLFSPELEITMEDMFAVYTAWAKEGDGQFRTAKWFHHEFQRLYPKTRERNPRKTGGGVKVYRGVGLTSTLSTID